MQQPWYAPDGDQRKSPEIVTGRRTSPSADACPTPHCGKTQRRPARHVPASATSTRVRVDGREPAQRTPSTRGARHRLPARMQLPRLPPRTHATPEHPHVGTARRHPHPACTQKVPGNKVFRIWQEGARDSDKKIAASAHGMGSGGLAVDDMAIGCLGVEPRRCVERFFSYLVIFCSCYDSFRWKCHPLQYKFVLEGVTRTFPAETVIQYMCYERRRACVYEWLGDLKNKPREYAEL
jgi:hypothetical protein